MVSDFDGHNSWVDMAHIGLILDAAFFLEDLFESSARSRCYGQNASQIPYLRRALV